MGVHEVDPKIVDYFMQINDEEDAKDGKKSKKKSKKKKSKIKKLFGKILCRSKNAQAAPALPHRLPLQAQPPQRAVQIEMRLGEIGLQFERRNAVVVCLAHPSVLLRDGSLLAFGLIAGFDAELQQLRREVRMRLCETIFMPEREL